MNNITFPAHIQKDQQPAILAHAPFARWLQGVANMGATAINVRDVIMFGPRPGFIFAEADAKRADGTAIPSATFIRGDSVAVLVVLKSDAFPDVAKSLVVRQARVPAGDMAFAEIPAGMMDNNGNFAGQAAKELAQETGITIDQSMLRRLGTFFVSPGGCDERMALLSADISLPAAQMKELDGRLGGEKTENEQTKVELCDLADLPARSGNAQGQDMKSVLAAALYSQLRSH